MQRHCNRLTNLCLRVGSHTTLDQEINSVKVTTETNSNEGSAAILQKWTMLVVQVHCYAFFN